MKNTKVTILALSIIGFSFLNTQADSYYESRREARRQRAEDRRNRRYRDGFTPVRDTADTAVNVADDTVDTGLNILTLGGHRRRQEERAQEIRDRNERLRNQEYYEND